MLRLFIVIAWLASPGAGFGQRPAITGTVVDPTEAGVAGARITLRSAQDAPPRSISADATGAFRIDSVAPGAYEITAEQSGFKPATIHVRIGTRPSAPLLLRLSVAELRSEVTVSEQSAPIGTDAANNLDNVTLDRQALDDLPIFDQDYIGAMSRFLDAGSVATGGVTLVVDGLEATRAGVSASAIQEVKINQDPYSAEFPRPGRGRIEIITKPGSSDYHGTFNFLFRDARLNARDPFALTRPDEQRRIFEGSLIGPLGHSRKTSFLVSANREEEDLQAIVFAEGLTGTIQQTLPTPSRNTELSGGITRQIGDNHVIAVRGVYTDRTIRNQGVGGFNVPSVAANFEDREDIVFFNHRGPIAGKFFNQFRFYAGRQHTPTTSVNPGPRIVVLGAFTTGGAQADRLQTENHIAIAEVVSWSGQRHTVRFGLNIPDLSRRGLVDNTNTAGTYTFSTLEDYRQNRPFSLLRQSGNGKVVFVEKLVGGFVQDEYHVRPNLQVSLGLRYDWQNYFHANRNFAPRASFAYAPGKNRKTVVRGGAGFFYDRTGPGPIFDLIRYNGAQLLQYLITDPSYPYLGAPGSPSIVRLDPTVRLPYLVQYGIGVERQLANRTTLTVNYYGTRGVDLFRSRDVNAPLPPLYTGRPNLAFTVWRQIESSASLRSNSLEVGLRGNVTRYFTGLIQYTLSRAMNDAGGNSLSGSRASLNSFPANSWDLTGEWARADFDQRNRFMLLGTLTPGRYFKLGVGLSLYSGQPYTMTTGRDDNRDGLANDRPAGVPRNTLQGPAYAGLDVRWSRDFFLARAKKDKGPTATLGVDAFNVLNRVNYAGYIGNLSSPFFGRPVAALPSRRLQLSLRFRF